jgi:hypothetical protein
MSDFDERRFMSREEAEADDTVDLHEHDDPGPRYKEILQRLVAALTRARVREPS